MEQTIRTKYSNAYKQIVKWIKENIPADSNFGYISGVHDVYRRDEICLRGNTLTIYSGSWGWGNDYGITGNIFEWYKDFLSVSDCGIVLSNNPVTQRVYDMMLKTFVKSWKSHYKPILEEKIAMYKSLENFEA